MGLLLRKQKGMMIFTGIAKLAITGFIVALSSSFVDTIWAVYMDSFLNSEVLVGFVSAFLTTVSFISFFIFIPFIEKSNKSRIYFFSLLLFAISYILFAINTKLYFFLILAFLLTILMTLRITSFGIIVRDKSKERQLSRNEGLIYTFFNTAWVAGPLIAGYISEAFGISTIFMLSAVFITIAALFFRISKIRDANIKRNPDKNLIKNLKDFFKNRDRVLIYILSGGVNLWWILIYLFMPLHMIRNGLHIIWVGYFLFAIALPLIFFEFIFAKLAGKIGFKKVFFIGFLIPALLSIACFFISSIYAVMGFLVLASIGLAMLEPTTEAYFFDIVDKKQECRFYGPYNTTIEINQFIAKIFSATLLIFLPFRYIFLLFGAFMLFFVLTSLRMRNVIERKKENR